MVLLRGVFWLSLVAALVPYSKIDRTNATFAIDEAALMKGLAELPHFCRDHGAICEKAEGLATIAAGESLTLAQLAAARLKTNAAAF